MRLFRDTLRRSLKAPNHYFLRIMDRDSQSPSRAISALSYSTSVELTSRFRDRDLPEQEPRYNTKRFYWGEGFIVAVTALHRPSSALTRYRPVGSTAQVFNRWPFLFALISTGMIGTVYADDEGAGAADANAVDVSEIHDWDADLCRAIEKGDYAAARLALDNNADVNARDGISPVIHRAIWKGQLDIFNLLLERGANINLVDWKQYSPLQNVMLFGAYFPSSADMLQALKDKGAVCPEPLLAAWEGRLDVLKALPNLNSNITDVLGNSLLHYAAANGQDAVVKWLIAEKRANTQLASQGGYTPLICAAYNGRTETAKYLLQHGAQITEADKKGLTALLHAAYSGQTETVRWLIEEAHVPITQADRDGWTALSYAAHRGQTETVRWLIEQAHVPITQADKAGWTALLHAANRGQTETVRWLIEQAHVPITQADQAGWTALLCAANRGQTETVRWLIEEAHVPITQADQEGRTALLHAANRGQTETVRWLIEQAHVPITQADQEGGTALLYAALGGHTETVRWLIEEAHVPITQADRDGWTALSYAAHRGQTETVRWLIEQAHVPITQADQAGRTALLHAANRGQTETVRWLIEQAHVPITQADQAGWTALLCAAARGHTETVRWLLSEEGGAQITEKSNHGWTALHLSVFFNRPEIYVLLNNTPGVRTDLQDMFGKDVLYYKDAIWPAGWGSTDSKTTGIRSVQDDIPNATKLVFKLQHSEIALKQARGAEIAAKRQAAEQATNTEERLKKARAALRETRRKDSEIAQDNFRKMLTERLLANIYADKAIYEGWVNPAEGAWDGLLEVGQFVSTMSDNVQTRMIVTLARLFAKNKIQEYRKNEAKYTTHFNNKSISEITQSAAELIAQRYRNQLQELSAEGMERFAHYFCDKMMKYFRSNPWNGWWGPCYDKSKICSPGLSSQYPYLWVGRKIPIEREMYDVMIDPNKGDSMTLQLKGKDNRTRNLDRDESWETTELIREVGKVAAEKVRTPMFKINEKGRPSEEMNDQHKKVLEEEYKLYYEIKPSSQKYGVCYVEERTGLRKLQYSVYNYATVLEIYAKKYTLVRTSIREEQSLSVGLLGSSIIKTKKIDIRIEETDYHPQIITNLEQALQAYCEKYYREKKCDNPIKIVLHEENKLIELEVAETAEEHLVAFIKKLEEEIILLKAPDTYVSETKEASTPAGVTP